MRRYRETYLLLVITAVLGLFIALPSSAKKKKARRHAPKEVVADTLSYNDSRRYAYFFLEAVRQQNAGHYAAAFDLISHCLDINPNAAEAYYMRSRYYGSLNNDSLALRDLETAARLSPANSTYQESVARQYIGTGDFNKATSAYEKLYAAHHDRDDVLAILIQLYRQQKEYTKMLGAIDRLEQVDGSSDQLALMRMNAYELMGDNKKAYATLKGLADSHPNDASFKLMLGNWLMHHQRQKEAFTLYQGVMQSEPDNAAAQSAMYDYYRSTGKDSLARHMMDRLLLGKNTPVETRLQFLRQAIQSNEQEGGDSTEIVHLIGRMQQVVPKDTMLAQMKVAYYSVKKMPTAVVDSAIVELLSLQPDNAGARLQLIQDHWGADNWQEIKTLSEPGMLYNPDEMVFYFFNGLARYYLKDNDGALNVLQRGVAEMNDKVNPDVAAEVYSVMGEIYHDKDMKQQAYAAYDSCLIWKPDNIMTLNNYAYYLSLDGVKLDKAAEMSSKAVKAEPKNATYLDTYAWILYKQQKYAEAKIYIDLALKNIADSTREDSLNSGTLYDHAGDIYVGLGDYQGAIAFYKECIKRGGDAKALNKKIKLYRKRK